VSVTFEIDMSRVDRQLDHLSDGPDTDDILRFEAIMAALFTETQIAAHLRTGHLIASGSYDTETRGDVWHGHIKYEANYAIYEQARGGLHDFMRPVYHADGAFLGALLAYVRGRE